VSKFKAWNIRDLAISLNAVPLDDGGYAEDEVMSLEWAEDQFSVYTGADGDVSRANTNNSTATVTLKYANTAGANDRLSALLHADLIAPNGAGAGIFVARDKRGRLVITAERAWIMGFPGYTAGKGVQVVEWKIQLANAYPLTFIGGR
jgi:Protein of unknown function (DUF3277)